jgi:type IV secretion system protein VirB9
VGGGDTVGWTVTNSSVDGVPHLYIKPVVETSTTNLIVTTEKHSYQLILNTSDWYNPMVTWTYEAENMANGLLAQAKENRLTTGQVATTNIASLDFSYHVSGGESSSRPSMVFSDGEKTFIKFDKMVARKYPLFIKEKGSKDMKITNYKVKDNYFIVEKVFDRAQIRLSDSEIITIKHSK